MFLQIDPLSLQTPLTSSQDSVPERLGGGWGILDMSSFKFYQANAIIWGKGQENDQWWLVKRDLSNRLLIFIADFTAFKKKDAG